MIRANYIRKIPPLLHLSVSAALAAIVSAIVSPGAAAQNTPYRSAAEAARQREPLARYVPGTVGFYMRLNTRPLRALGSVPGASTSVDTSGSYREWFRQLDGTAVVIAARSWRDRGTAITICEPPDPQAFADSYLQLSTARLVTEERGIRIYELQKDRWVATNDHVFICSDAGPESELFTSAARLLDGPNGSELIGKEDFIRLSTQAAPSSTEFFYVKDPWRDSASDAAAGSFIRPLALPDLKSIAVDVRSEKLRKVCHVRGLRRLSYSPPAAAVSAEQLKMLPISTVAAWSFVFEPEALRQELAAVLPESTRPFHWQLLGRLLVSELTGRFALSELGGRGTACILRTNGNTADRVALIVERRGPSATAEHLAQLCEEAANACRSHPDSQQYLVSLNKEVYGGHAIYYLSVAWLDEPGGLWDALGDWRPAFASLAGQLVLASHPGAIKELIDAHQRSGYSLPVFEQWAHSSTANPPAILEHSIYVDPARLGTWLAPLCNKLSQSPAELLESEWFQQFVMRFGEFSIQMGVTLSRDSRTTPGKVFVLAVKEDAPAFQKIRRGDYIIGIDGVLLSLEQPLDDLKEKLNARRTERQRMVRIERNNEVLDVLIDFPHPSSKNMLRLLTDAGAALDYLTQLGAAVDNITYRQSPSAWDSLHAEIILNLRGPAEDERP